MKYLQIIAAIVIFVTTARPAAGLTKICDIARPSGERPNRLLGHGLVFGLNGTGDSSNAMSRNRSLMGMLQKMGTSPDNIKELKVAKNVAEVIVTAEIPRNGVRDGDKIDVTVSSLNDAKSLAGGTLVMTELFSAHSSDDRLYAWAQGPITLPDTENATSGLVKGGAVMEGDVNYYYVNEDDKGHVYFDLVLDDDQASWQASYTLAMLVNQENAAPGEQMGQAYLDTGAEMQETAVAVDPRTVRIFIPEKQTRNPASFIARIMRMPVDLPAPEATIVIHEKTGTIAFSYNVEIVPVAVTINGLTIRIVRPEPEPTPGQPQVVDSEWAKFDTSGEGNTAKLNDLITALDQLNVPVDKKIAAIYALQDAGALRARIVTK